MGISQNAMARAIGVAPRAINEIVHGKRSITPAMSLRFGAFFGQHVRRSLLDRRGLHGRGGAGRSNTFWHGLQVECDFRAIAKDRKKLTSGIQPADQISHAG
jgi:plasmid maintenance system antidote protein VapI